MLKPEIVHIATADNLLLPGLFFEPEQKTKKALVMLHGNGGSSILRYRSLTKAFVSALHAHQTAYLPFNNRGAGYYTKVDLAKPEGSESSRKYGMAYEQIEEAVADIEAVTSFLQSRGYTEINLIGYSTGANKICIYNFLKPQNPIHKYILACGGDDVGIYYNQWGADKFYSYLDEAKMAVENGRGRDLILELVKEGLIISYQSLLDTIDPNGSYNCFSYHEVLSQKRLGTKHLFQEFSSITKPSLVVYGDQDEFCYGQVNNIMEILKHHTSPNASMEYQLIEGADHGFTGKETELAQMVVKFLAS